MIANAAQLAQLLRDKMVTSADWNNIRALINGEVNTFMGFTFVRSELLPKAANVRTCIAFCKPAMMYRGRKLTDATLIKRPDRSFNCYAYYKGFHGTLRRFDQGVVTIACAEQ